MQFDLEEIKKVIAEHYGWGSTSDWTNFHFKELSKEIERLTGKRISDETLKRIFGKRKMIGENYNPQAFSQIALLKFVDKIKSQDNNSIDNNSEEKLKVRFSGRNMAILAFVFVVLIFGYWIAGLMQKSEKGSFKCENPRDGFPYTATFKYDVSEISDSVFADFGNKEESFLPPGKTMINNFYSYPGDFKVKFYTRKRALDSLRVIAWSRDWQAGFFPNSMPELFQYFHDQQFYRQQSCFYASPEGLKNEGVDIKERNWTAYKYFHPFRKSLDNLSLETRVENNASTGSLTCFDVELILMGDSGSVDLKFTQPKCSRYANLRVSEKYLDGKYNDLSAFTVDMSDWLQIKMTTAENTLRIYLDERLIFTQNYEKEMGLLIGVVCQFFGTGRIDYIDLREPDGKVFYRNDFGY